MDGAVGQRGQEREGLGASLGFGSAGSPVTAAIATWVGVESELGGP